MVRGEKTNYKGTDTDRVVGGGVRDKFTWDWFSFFSMQYVNSNVII